MLTNVTFTIGKEFHFSASHRLTHLGEDHKCYRLHGHNYRVVIHLSSVILDENGFVIDYGDLRNFKAYIDNELDHRHLNDVLGGPVQTTAEMIALHLFEWAREHYGDIVVGMRVEETPTTYAEVWTLDR